MTPQEISDAIEAIDDILYIRANNLALPNPTALRELAIAGIITPQQYEKSAHDILFELERTFESIRTIVSKYTEGK